MLELVEQVAVPEPLHAYVVLELMPVQVPASVTFPPPATLEGVAVRLQLGADVGGNTVTVATAAVEVLPEPLFAVRV